MQENIGKVLKDSDKFMSEFFCYSYKKDSYSLKYTMIN